MSLSLETTIANFNSTTPILAKLNEVDPETCRLLGPFALVVQAIMGLLVVGSLLLKRTRESPKRKWRVWIADLSKQVLGQAFVHGSNVLISDQIASHKSDNPCSLYFINIAIDTTFGVLLLYAFLLFFTSLLLLSHPNSFKTGYYGSPFSLKIWFRQAAVYVFCLGLMKLVVVGLFWIFPGLFKFGNWALGWVTNDDAQVVFVMLIFPLVMNVLQFLIIDSFLKSKSTSPNLNESTSLESDDQDEEERGFLDPTSSLESGGEDDHAASTPTTPSFTSRRVETKYDSLLSGGAGGEGKSREDQFIIDDEEEELESPRTPPLNHQHHHHLTSTYPPPSSNTTTPTKIIKPPPARSNSLLEELDVEEEVKLNRNGGAGLEWEGGLVGEKVTLVGL